MKLINIIGYYFRLFLKYRSVNATISFAKTVIYAGLTVAAPAGLWWLAVTFQLTPENWPLTLEFGAGPNHITYLGIAIILAGIGIGLSEVVKIQKTKSSRLVYLRGLPGMNSEPPTHDMPQKFRQGKVDHVKMKTHHLDNQSALDEVQRIDWALNGENTSMGSDAPETVFAGLAPIPLLFAMGVKLGARNDLHIMDYDRNKKHWHMLDDFDDGEEIEVVFPEHIDDAREIAIAMPLNLDFPASQIPDRFMGKTVWVKLKNNAARVDAFSSETKLMRLVSEYNELIRNIRGREGFTGLESIHLFIAGQSSTIFRLATQYQENTYPELCVYHFQADTQEYTWGLSIKGREMKLIR